MTKPCFYLRQSERLSYGSGLFLVMRVLVFTIATISIFLIISFRNPQYENTLRNVVYPGEAITKANWTESKFKMIPSNPAGYPKLQSKELLEQNNVYYLDSDGDGYGNPAVSTVASSGPPPGYVANNQDCNDSKISIHPGAVEICDGVDNDCDGQIDEGFDQDGDGFTTCGSRSGPGQAYTTILNPSLIDCNDADATIYPGAPEICDGLDNNCNGIIDETPQLVPWYQDLDGDLFGNPAINVLSCTKPIGYVLNNLDCDDNNGGLNPNTFWFLDFDNDNYYTGNYIQQCTSPGPGYKWTGLTGGGDCDDNNNNVHPGATEVCNNIDDNCDGQINEGCPSPSITISNSSAFESAGSAIINVNLSYVSDSIVTAKFKTSNGTAKSPRDYTATSGTITINAGLLMANIIVPVVADTITEGDETFFVTLSKSVGASISNKQAVVTIRETSTAGSSNQNKYLQPDTQPEANIAKAKVSVPNPQAVNSVLCFYNINPGTFDLVLTDLMGKAIVKCKNYRNNWKMSSLTPGLYIYQLTYFDKSKGKKINVIGKIFILDVVY